MADAEKKVYSYLGLAMRAGKLSDGEFSVTQAIKEFKACLVIVAEDASDNTKKKLKDACVYRNIPIVEKFDRESISHAIGKENRVAVAINDAGFANAILSCVDNGGRSDSEKENI